jgi:hypothetical protein
MDLIMELIDPKEVKKITEARKIIEDLQVRLLAREQALDDLSRSVEIAELTKQFQLVTSFREAAEEQLKSRVVVPAIGENQELNIRIYE